MDDTSIEEVERSTSDYEMVEETGKVISEQTTAEGTNDVRQQMTVDPFLFWPGMSKAPKKNTKDAVDMIKELPSIDIVDEDGKTVLRNRAIYLPLSLYLSWEHFWLQVRDRTGKTPLLAGFQNGRLAANLYLLAKEQADKVLKIMLITWIMMEIMLLTRISMGVLC